MHAASLPWWTGPPRSPTAWVFRPCIAGRLWPTAVRTRCTISRSRPASPGGRSSRPGRVAIPRTRRSCPPDAATSPVDPSSREHRAHDSEAPTLLAVVLAQQMYGRSAVALVAVAFTVGSLCAPAVAAQVRRRQGNTYQAWPLCALGMDVLWPFAGMHLAVLCAAKLLSGLCMTALEGLLDATTAAEATGSVTGALARATAAGALGSAAGTAILPLAVVSFGLSTSTGTVTGILIATVVAVGVGRFAAARGRGHTALARRLAAATDPGPRTLRSLGFRVARATASPKDPIRGRRSHEATLVGLTSHWSG